MSLQTKPHLSKSKSRHQKTNVHFDQVMGDILQTENLLPPQARSLEKAKECIEGLNNPSIYSIKDSFILQKIRNIGSDVTCIRYMSGPFRYSHNYKKITHAGREHKLSECQGLWLGDREGTISIYSPVTKMITRSVFGFENRLKNLIYMNGFYIYHYSSYYPYYVIACGQNGDIGIMGFHEKYSETYFFSHFTESKDLLIF